MTTPADVNGHVFSASAWSGAIIAGAGALTLSQWLAIGGFLLALIGTGVNVWHKITMARIAKRELALKIERGLK